MPFTDPQLLAWWGCQNRHRCDIEQYRLLKRCSDKKDMSDWNVWRRQNPREEIFLQGADLSGFYLYGANLYKGFFEGANCQMTDFHRANCKNANFTMANCRMANFESANCHGTIFFSANCQTADFLYANCYKAIFYEAKCHAANFSYCNCQGADFLNANCFGTDFLNANCQAANFWGASCQNANFDSASCQGSDFQYANCQMASFHGANCQGARFLNADCTGTDFTRTNLQSVEFCHAIFNHQTRLAKCVIDRHTDCTNSNLAHANIKTEVYVSLKRNIRYKRWEKWYESIEHQSLSDSWYSRLCPKFFSRWNPKRLITSPIRFFWWLSDYGYNTRRFAGASIVFIFLFAAIIYGISLAPRI